MADSGGHWSTLAEAQKLTQSMLIPGVVEEDIKRGNPLERIPVAQAANSGKSIKWLREATVIDGAVANIAVGEQLSWSEDVTYTEVETELKISYLQRKLDKFVAGIYGNINNYEARVLLEMRKGLIRQLGDRLIYGDTTYGSSKQFDGYHALAYDRGATPGTPANMSVDMAEAGLSFGTLRTVIDSMKHGVNEILMPFEIARRIDAVYQEKGLVGLATGTAGTMGMVSFGWNEAGKRQTFWDGIPIMRTDYLVAEQANTGTGADSAARAKHSSGDKQYSIFFIRYGQVMNGDPGVSFAFGGTEGLGDFYKLEYFPQLEDFDAKGIRMVNYGAVLQGSTMSLARIWDIEDAAVVV